MAVVLKMGKMGGIGCFVLENRSGPSLSEGFLDSNRETEFELVGQGIGCHFLI